MKWEKKGLIYHPPFDGSWKDNSALTPTPFRLNKDTIRVYCGFRDPLGISRIGYVDINAENPEEIIKVSEEPVLDIGESGMFDDNGVILGEVFAVEDEIRMYYVGFQIVEKAKFLAFTGLAISRDNGESFKKVQKTPVLDRSKNSSLFNAIHSVIYENGKYRCWLGAGSGWLEINGTNYPSYNVKYSESVDGVSFPKPSVDCLSFGKNEYRIGRPRVWKSNHLYQMMFTWGDKLGNYQMGYARSEDGIIWERDDEYLNFKPSEIGWDSTWSSYGAIIKSNQSEIMVYNGNSMGKEGFGLAILKK